ncbi:MAG: glutathione S-transferase family protein [Phenylobacterium sp.]|uniref:glutathione S-transferase family protein n=1 Tax=Phenylobacterium sp. TaxID=1871053 RepID=UPI00391AD26D
MKLYDTPRAPNPRRVRWVMAEKGIEDIEIETLNLMEGQHRTPEYMAKTGLAQVPVLELDDGTCISESLAICRYLEGRYPEPNLFGRTPEETAVIEMWTRRAELMVAMPFMLGVRHSHPALAALEKQDAAVGAWNLEAATRALKVFDRRLADSAWIAADRLTIADVVAFISYDFARGMLKYDVPAEMTHVARWIADMKARPAAAVAR